MQRRQGYQVRFLLAVLGVRGSKCKKSVADLFDVYSPTEARFLSVVPLQLDTVFFVADTVGCYWWVVGDLL